MTDYSKLIETLNNEDVTGFNLTIAACEAAYAIADLSKQLADAQKDAERYRWLAKTNSETDEYNEVYACWPNGSLDKCVDAAISAQKEEA